jgi:hypothetical protein
MVALMVVLMVASTFSFFFFFFFFCIFLFPKKSGRGNMVDFFNEVMLVL